jgi:hypothetical protein
MLIYLPPAGSGGEGRGEREGYGRVSTRTKDVGREAVWKMVLGASSYRQEVTEGSCCCSMLLLEGERGGHPI